MNLIIDGSVFEWKGQRGIARIFMNTLPLICETHPDVNVTLLFRNNPQIPYPHHPQIKTIILSNVYILRPWRFSRRYKKLQNALILLIGGLNPRNIWFSTYFTTPPSHWKGKRVLFVYDMIFELFPELLPGSKKAIDLKKDAIINVDKVFCISHSNGLGSGS